MSAVEDRATSASADRSQRDTSDQRERRHDLRWAAAGGLAAAVVGFGTMALVGLGSSYEARRLIEAVLPTVRFAAAAYIGAGATVLALMLTLLTFSISNDLDFRRQHYQRIRDIAGLTAAVIVGSVLLLMFLSFPIGEAEVEAGWYLWVYYALLLGGAVMGGVFIAAVLMLFYAISGLVGVGRGDETNGLLVTDDD